MTSGPPTGPGGLLDAGTRRCCPDYRIAQKIIAVLDFYLNVCNVVSTILSRHRSQDGAGGFGALRNGRRGWF